MQLPITAGSELYLYGILSAAHIWLLILAALGFAKKYLSFSNSFLRYTNKAVYPFYILHQTVIVVAGYYIVQLQWPIALKFFMLVLICFCILFILYHFVISRFVVTRILYGMKRKKKPVASALAEDVQAITAPQTGGR
jgi:glucans biosynthesis protein C